MSSGWRAPAPLPMYQPVVLKHVPTMVRRRYDHLDLDLDLDDVEIQNDGDIHQHALESKYITSATHQGGCISENHDDLEASNLSHQVDNGVSVECQRSEVENSIENCETETQSTRVDNDLQSVYSECDNDGSDIVNNAPTVEWTLEDETRDKRLSSFSNEQGSVSEDDDCDKSEMEHLEFIVDTVVKDETLDNGLENSSNDQDSCQSQDDSQQDSNLSSEVDASVSVEGQHSRLGNSNDDCVTRTYTESISSGSIKQTDLDSENSKSKDDGSNGSNHALIVDFNPHEDECHEAKHKRLPSLSNEQALDSKYRENEDDGPKVTDHAPIMVRGGYAPPPLPMYHPVVLQHVPTMVKRRYDHSDSDKLDQIEDDGGFDVNDDDNLGSENSSCEQGSALEDDECDGSDMEHSSCIVDTSVKGWRESEDDDLQDSNPSSEVDDGISVECQLNGEENSTDNCETGTYCESVGTRSIKQPDVPTNDGEIEDDGDLDDEDGLLSEQGWHEREADDLQNSNSSSTVDPCVSVECQQSGVDNSIGDCETGICDESVRNRSIQPTDLHSGNRESEDDESEIANSAPIVDSDLDEGETQDKRLAYLGNELECYQLKYAALHSEYSESKDYEPKFAYDAPIVVSNLENEIQDKRLVDFSNEEGDRKDEYNEAEDAKTASYPIAKYESLDVTDGNSTDEQGLHPEDYKRDGDITEENPSICTNASLKSEAEMIECGSIDDDKHDTITQMYTEDFGTQNIIRRRRSLDIMNLKSESNGTEDINSSYNVNTAVKTQVQGELSQRYSNYPIEFKPETRRKSTEEDVYELMCPYCKHCFTSTLIVQRKDNSQDCRITCFTSFIAL
ncbi:hypothetical protein KSS87_015457 [Heliosperma pusillum]|nr:hypothetical protein KSS87_015457 [Heliosperma pusillum]